MGEGLKLIGVGNRYRGDDGAGLRVIELLADQLPESCLAGSDGEISQLLNWFDSHEEIVIIDAVDANAARLAPGSVLRLDVADGPLEATALRASTHAMGLAEAVELARNLGTLPDRLTVFGIAGEAFAYTEGLSVAVEQAACELARQLQEDYADA